MRKEAQMPRMMHEEINENLEFRVQKRTAELEEAKTRAEAASKAKSEFLANMSHELRTPLNSIIGFTRRLIKSSSDILDQRSMDALQAVNKNGHNLLEIINDILDTAKIESGTMSLKKEYFNIISSVSTVCTNIEPLLAEKALALNIVHESEELIILILSFLLSSLH